MTRTSSHTSFSAVPVWLMGLAAVSFPLLAARGFSLHTGLPLWSGLWSCASLIIGVLTGALVMEGIRSHRFLALASALLFFLPLVAMGSAEILFPRFLSWSSPLAGSALIVFLCGLPFSFTLGGALCAAARRTGLPALPFGRHEFQAALIAGAAATSAAMVLGFSRPWSFALAAALVLSAFWKITPTGIFTLPGRDLEKPTEQLNKNSALVWGFFLGAYWLVASFHFGTLFQALAPTAALAGLAGLIWFSAGRRFGSRVANSLWRAGLAAAFVPFLFPLFLRVPRLFFENGGSSLFLTLGLSLAGALLVASPLFFLGEEDLQNSMAGHSAFWLSAVSGALAAYLALNHAPHWLVWTIASTGLLAFGFFRELPYRSSQTGAIILRALAALLLVAALFTSGMQGPEESSMRALPTRAFDKNILYQVEQGEHGYTFYEDSFKTLHSAERSAFVSNSKYTLRSKALVGLVASLLRPQAHSVLYLDSTEQEFLRGFAINSLIKHIDFVVDSPAHPLHALDLAPIQDLLIPPQPLTSFPTRTIHTFPGRSFFYASDRSQFGLMVNRPADPWNGNPAYHTVDFLKLAKARLSGNGLVLTRVDTRWLGRRDIGKLMRSYGAVFSYVQIWAMDYRDVYLLASDRPLAPPFPSFIQGLAGDTPISQFVRNYRIGQIPYDLIRLFRANAWEIPETGESSSTLRDASLNWSGSLKFHSLDKPEKERYGLRMFLDLPETRLAIANMGFPRGEELVLPVLGLAARIQKGWRVSFVGMRFLPTPESDARDVTPMFEIASTDNKHQIGAWPHYLSTPLTPTLQDIVTEVSRGEMITTGEGGINRHPMRWSLTSNDGGFEFTGAWYCQPLNSYFVTRYRDESSEKSDWDAMRKSLLSQITCQHPPPPEAS